ncbi:MAG: PAS domain S-box protein [Chloroflexi bacterium]|nr:PAS domain S-box protein [Chloroflexota bacterium]
MTLRQKTIVIIALMFVSLVLVLYAILRTTLLREFSHHDAAQARRGAQQALAMLEADLSNLGAITEDWAAWDDTYAFVQGANPDYVQSNLVEGTFTALRLNLMVFLDASGQIVEARAFDLDNVEEAPVPASLLAHLGADSPLLRHDGDGVLAGVLMLPEVPVLVASSPILTSMDEGPARGSLIMGRYLTEGEIQGMAQRALLALSAVRLDEQGAQADVERVRAALSPQTPTVTQVVDEERMAGYALVQDIYGAPVLALRVQIPRDSYMQGLIATRYLLAGVVALVLLFGAVILALLQKSVLTPLAHLSAAIGNIGASSDFAQRVDAKGRDELAVVGRTVNRTLEALEAAHRRYRDLFDRVPVGLYRTRPDGSVIDANPALAHMLGYPDVESLLKVNTASVHIAPEQRERERALLEQQGAVRGIELQLRRADGSTIWAQDNVYAVRDAEGNVQHYEGSLVDITQRKRAEEERERLIGELQKALSEVRTLSGLLPICASCKRIRDDQGYWRQVEEYVRDHTEVEFTHSICPDCMKRLYPEFSQGDE